MPKIFVVVLVALALSGCADSVSFAQAESMEKVGFWYGLWHGLIIVFSWIGSLIYDDIAVYAIYNNGGWYDFGFVLGVGGFGFSSGLLNSSD